MKLQVVIPSKGRSDTIGKHTLRLFPDATVVVDEVERDDYLKVVDERRLVTHPSVYPVTKLMNWLLERFLEPGTVTVTADDDITSLRAMPGWRPRTVRDPQVAREVLENAAQCVIDAQQTGVPVSMFGFNQSEHPLFFKPFAPLRLNRWVGTVIGYVGDPGVRFDERAWCHGDADLCLQSLLKHRIVWCDERWAFVCIRLENSGGNTGQRDAARDEQERRYLKRKWGRFIDFHQNARNPERIAKGLGGTVTITALRVPRKQGA